MRKLIVQIGLRPWLVSGLLVMFSIAAPPALSQEGDLEAEAAVETVVVEDAEAEESAEPDYVAVTAKNPEISTLQLQLLLSPLTAEELAVEADAWLLSLRERVQSISELEFAIEQESEIIQVRKDIQGELEKAQKSNAPKGEVDAIERRLNRLNIQANSLKAAPEFKEIFAEAKVDYAIVSGEDLVDQARARLSSIENGESTDEATALIKSLESALGSHKLAAAKLEEPFFSDAQYEDARQLVEKRETRVSDAYQALANTPIFTPQLGDADTQEQVRAQLIAQATVLEASRSNLVTRVQLVLDELEKKGGDIESYDRYVKAVTGLDFDVTDAQGIKVRFLTWLQSEDGGIKLGIGLLKFGGILIGAMIIAPRVGQLSNKLLGKVNGMSNLFREFTVVSIERGVLVLGGLLSLAALGVNLGPILAVVGGASFVFAFALQSNLGNFASGLMLLINKPFDVGDEVKVAGYWAYVDSISLANTKLKDFGGNIITLPNNTVWGGDIINYTHAEIRKIQLGINVKFAQDVEQVKALWTSIASAHPKVLKDPGISIFPWSSTYDYKIRIGLNAWSTTDDYWYVYVDLLKALQKGLAAHNIELAAPVQEIKLDGSSTDAIAEQLPSSSYAKTTAAVSI